MRNHCPFRLMLGIPVTSFATKRILLVFVTYVCLCQERNWYLQRWHWNRTIGSFCNSALHVALITALFAISVAEVWSLHTNCQVFLSECNKLLYLSTDFHRTLQNQISRKFFHWERRWYKPTDGHEEHVGASRDLCERAKNWQYLYCWQRRICRTKELHFWYSVPAISTEILWVNI
jgi:hypothetical protein